MASLRPFFLRTWRLFQSRELAFVLLAVLTGAVMVATFLPQRANLTPAQYQAWRERWGVVGWLVEFLSLNQVYSSWWFYTALALVLVSTLACTVTRFGQELRRTGREWGRLGPEEIGRLPYHGVVALRAPVGPGLRGVRRWLESRGWLVRWEVVDSATLRQAQGGASKPSPALQGGRSAASWPEGQGCKDGSAPRHDPQPVIASEATQSLGLLRGPEPGRRGRPRPRPGVGLGAEADYGPGGVVGYLFAEKGWLSSLGSIIFHLSLLVIALGVVYSQAVRQEGFMIIAEGETVTEQRPDYLLISKVPLLGEDYRAFQVRLERFVPTYYEGFIGVDYAADLAFIDEGTTVKWQRLRVNEPVSHKGVTFVLERYGFSPRFVWRDEAGRVVFDYFVNLMVLGEGMVDGFEIAEAGLEVRARFFPDMVMEEGRPATRSLEPRNPVFLVEVARGREQLFLGLMGQNQPVPLAGGSLSFADLKYWTQYRAIKDPGMGLVFAGFWVGLGALVVRYLYTRKRLWGFVEEGRLVLGGRAEQFGAIFGEEFERLLADLEKDGVLSPPFDKLRARSKEVSSGPR